MLDTKFCIYNENYCIPKKFLNISKNGKPSFVNTKKTKIL